MVNSPLIRIRFFFVFSRRSKIYLCAWQHGVFVVFCYDLSRVFTAIGLANLGHQEELCEEVDQRQQMLQDFFFRTDFKLQCCFPSVGKTLFDVEM